MKAKLVRTGKNMSLSSPQFFFAQDRALADEAFAGDVVGIPNHGTLRIGDTLTEGEDLTFVGVPSFAPEIVRRVRLTDAMKAKKLKEALQQMSEEGVVQVFRPRDGAPALVGVVGPLQLDVLKARLDAEYSLPVEFEVSEFSWRAGFRPTTARSSIHSWRTIFRRRGRCRRRSGVSGQERILSRLHQGTRRRHCVLQRQGREEQGVTPAVVLRESGGTQYAVASRFYHSGRGVLGRRSSRATTLVYAEPLKNARGCERSRA